MDMIEYSADTYKEVEVGRFYVIFTPSLVNGNNPVYMIGIAGETEVEVYENPHEEYPSCIFEIVRNFAWDVDELFDTSYKPEYLPIQKFRPASDAEILEAFSELYDVEKERRETDEQTVAYLRKKWLAHRNEVFAQWASEDDGYLL